MSTPNSHSPWYTDILTMFRGMLGLSAEATEQEIHQAATDKMANTTTTQLDSAAVADQLSTLAAENTALVERLTAMEQQLAAVQSGLTETNARLSTLAQQPAAAHSAGDTPPAPAATPQKAYGLSDETATAARWFQSGARVMATLALMLTCLVGAQAQRYIDINVPQDTLTNQVTKIYTTSPTFIDAHYTYSVHLTVDSLSGSNAGTAYLEFCNDRTGTRWYTAQTLTIDGTGSDEAFWEGELRARRIRIRIVLPSGTRKDIVHLHAALKRTTER